MSDQTNMFPAPEPGPWKTRALQLVEASVAALDAAGHTTAPIAMYSADYHKVRRHLGIKRGKVMIGQHRIVNGGPRYRKRKDQPGTDGVLIHEGNQ